MIGTTSSEEKAKMAFAAGAHHIINYTTHDFVEEVKRITNERKVSVVFDGVGMLSVNIRCGCCWCGVVRCGEVRCGEVVWCVVCGMWCVVWRGAVLCWCGAVIW